MKWQARTSWAIGVLLAGCASTPATVPSKGVATTASAPAASPAPGAASAPASAASAPVARPDPSGLRPFADVISGATQQPGWLPVWRKAERFWLEIPEAQLQPNAPPLLLSVNVASSVGERGLYASQMGPQWLVSLRKLAGPQIQLVALNTNYVADNAPMQAAVQEGFSNSLIASFAVASAPHPERKSVLVDASFLVSDLMNYGTALERSFRLGYGLDRGNSFIEKVQTGADQASFSLRLHFVTPRLPVLGVPNAPQVVLPSTPDPRSLFVGMVVNFTKLPEQAMRPRLGDTRLGHFADTVTDLSDDRKVKPRQWFINRWRLEKKDPEAALSEPRQPIVFWLDKNIPLRYRDAVTRGILEWNKAFEKIGFKNAIVVHQQPADAEWSTLDGRHASVRWYVGADASVAQGPHHSDPRTGEILDADISMSDVFGRGARRLIVEDGGFAQRWQWPGTEQFACDYGHRAAAEMDFAMDVLEARGDLAPDSPQAEAFAQAVVKDTITHEVGHTLGLRHNFKASTAYTPAQLQDKEFTATHGISASVMDYNATNLPLAREPGAVLVNNGLGPYDYWAIEYAYKPLSAAEEPAELARIAARSTEPGLAYADDADAGYGPAGVDPLANRFDLSNDPLAFWQRRLQLAHELWERVQQRGVHPDDDVTRQRRVLLRGFARLAPAAEMVSKYVGGIETSREPPHPGARPAYVPVPASRQREALRVLAQGFFNADSFRFKPEFLASAITDYEEGDRNGPPSVPAAVLQLQSAALDRLFSTGTAVRLLEARLYAPKAQQAQMMSLSEVYLSLQRAIWSELASGGDIDSLRRNLQREHLRRLQGLLTRGPNASGLPADAMSLLRLHATSLQGQLRSALARGGHLSVETRAHLQDSLSQLTEALHASMQRST